MLTDDVKKPMNKDMLTEEKGACKFCGQMSVFQVPKTWDDDVINEYATELCKCGDALVYTGRKQATAVARYTLAVDRRRGRNNGDGEQTADFINCVSFGRAGKFAEKYFHKGIKIAITWHIQTGSYTNKGGAEDLHDGCDC